MVRVSLTQKQLATKAGTELLRILKATTADGIVDEQEVNELRNWLTELPPEVDMPAVTWLRELVEVILEDGVVTKEERHELLLAIERVLPMEERSIAKMRRREAKRREKEEEDARRAAEPDRWEDEPATDRQITYMEFLGIDFNIEGLTKGQASTLITECTEAGKPSNRQMMVLRFWDKVAIASEGRSATSDWMDDWYAEDPDHLRAWELWKSENGDMGLQSDPSVVPIGVGFECLKRLQRETKASSGSNVRVGRGGWTFIIVLVLLGIGYCNKGT